MNRDDKRYDPKAVEERWYPYWVEHGFFHATPERGGEPFCIVIPPPNVTGILHMGHALNNTIQDVIIRWRRMQGYNALWVPGTDHAGIATQNVVERELQKEGTTRQELGREAFVQRIWAWREKYGATITNQLKRLGASCDWERERFTMDEGLSNAVAEVFVRLYEKGLIYRGHYIINWCPRCQTALSDEESEHEDLGGKLYYLRYPVWGGERKAHVVVATTRPETMLGDVAVAVHPEDERYRHLLGKTIRLPILNRELRVIEDPFVDPAFGTGIVKVTPAHDPNDFEMGLRHGLSPINVMNDDGTMNEEAGPYVGMDRFACRENIVEDLKDAGLIERMEDHDHAVGHCYRCHTMVEPRLSTQWFVRMKPLAEPAIRAVKEGRISFVPDRWTKVYLEWMEHIRDWCISRQIWWGHRIPVFYCPSCGHEWAGKAPPPACPACGAEHIRQDDDVLDTWFSSWLWPFSVFGWPEERADLAFYYPTRILVTASEIIFFWVARMIMAGLEFMGDIPFSRVYIHGTVRDDSGLKMSKSLGNSIDPLDIIERYSADALRFSLVMLTATGQDVFLSTEKFELGRNFGTKIWNAARYMRMHMSGQPGDTDKLLGSDAPLSADDQHILAKLNDAVAACTEHLERCRLNDYAKTLYEFFWHHFCDWYVEYSKEFLYGEDEARKEQVLQVMNHVFCRALRLLHPVTPFLTEELWQRMGYRRVAETILLAPWPEPAAYRGVAPELVEYVDAKHELIRAGRTLRADYQVAPSQKVDYVIRVNRPEDRERLSADRGSIASLLRADGLALRTEYTPEKAMPSAITPLGAIHMSLEGLVDTEAELARLNEQLAKLDMDLERVTKKLNNEGFVNKAPRDVVEREKGRKEALLEKRGKLEHIIETLSEMQRT